MSFNDYIYWQTLQETGKTPEEIYEYEHPKVVRCKYCKYHNTHKCFMAFDMIVTEDNGYCYMGERTDHE